MFPRHSIKSGVHMRTPKRARGCAERIQGPARLLYVGNRGAKTLGRQRPTLWRQTRYNCQQEETLRMSAHLTVRQSGGQWKKQRSQDPATLSEFPSRQTQAMDSARLRKEPCARSGLGGTAGHTGGLTGQTRVQRMEGREEQMCWEERSSIETVTQVTSLHTHLLTGPSLVLDGWGLPPTVW